MTDPGRMHWLAMKKIFEGLTSYEEVELWDAGLAQWCKRKDLTPNDKLELNRIINALIADEKTGYFDKSKYVIAKFKIKYWRLFKAGLPYINLDPNDPKYA